MSIVESGIPAPLGRGDFKPATLDTPPPKAPDVVRTEAPPTAPEVSTDTQKPFNSEDHAKTTRKLIRDVYAKAAAPKASPEQAPKLETEGKPKPEAIEKPDEKEVKGVLEVAAPVQDQPPEVAIDDLPEAKIKLADNASEPARKNFAELRKITDSLRQELAAKAKAEADLRQQLDTFKSASPAEMAEFSRLREEHKAMSDKLAILNLAEHPDFHKQYTKPIQDTLAEAQEIIAYNGIEEGDVKNLLSQPRKEFNAAVAELTKDMNSMDATTVQASLRHAYKLHEESKGALAKSQELAQAFRQKSALAQKEAFESVSKDLGPTGAFLTAIPDDPDWSAEQKAANARYNESIAQQRSKAEHYAFGALTPKEQALVAHKAAIADHLTEHLIPRAQKEYQELREMNRQLAAQIKTLKAAKATGQATGDVKQGKDAGAPAGSLKELVARAYGRR